MPLLAALGTLSYNGYSFDGTAHLSVSVEYVHDDAGRTIVYHKHVIHVDCVIQNDAGTDDDMTNLRRRLGEQGRELVFINRGFGDDLVVNSPNGVLRDVKWGPVPRVLKWEPIAHIRAHDVSWEVETCVPVCDNQTSRAWGILALNYGQSFDIDQRGYTTRTITGYVEIAMTRVGRALPDIADAGIYLDAYNTAVPLGFHRTQSRQISLDKSRLDFTVVDQEIDSPNAYPAGVANITCRHRTGWRLGSGLPRNRLTCEIEMQANQPPEHALLIFMAIANQRLTIARNAIVAATSTAGGTTSAKGAVLLDEFDVEEDVFSSRSSFSLGYRIPATIKQFLHRAGIWTPLPTNWAAWERSMATAHNQRGWAQMGLLPQDDSIVDLCQTGVRPYDPQRGPPIQQVNRKQLSPLKNVCPLPENSWLGYWQTITTSRERPVVRQRVLQTPETDQTPYTPNDPNGQRYPDPTGTDDIVQQGGQGSYYVTVMGSGTRMCYPIPRPKYAYFGSTSQPATEVSGKFISTIKDNAFGAPIYQAAWHLVYYVPNSVSQMKPLENPMEFLKDDGTAAP